MNEAPYEMVRLTKKRILRVRIDRAEIQAELPITK